jgi:hypothetical protein
MARSDLVDIIFTITGCSKPPSLPLREELNSNGFEIVYNAKGVCKDAVAAKERKEALLEKIKTIEYKLENKKSYRRSKKKMTALNKIREIKAKLEAADTAVDSKTYLDQLSRVPPAKTVSTEEENTEKMNYKETFEDKQSFIQISFQSCKEEDVSLKGFEVDEQEMLSLASINHDDIEDDISKVLECMDEDEYISSDDESGDSFTLDSNLIKEQFESDHNPGNIVVGNHSSSSKKKNDFDFDKTESNESEDDTISVKWEHVNIDTRFDNKRAISRTPGIESITYYYTSPDAGPTKSKTVRFKNVKPTTEEALEKCRALTQQVRIMQLSFSMENNSVDSSTVSSDEGFEAIIAKASDDVMLDRLLEFSINGDMDRSHASTLSLTDDQFEEDDSITDSCESTFAKIPLTKCQILAEKRNEFRKNMKKQGMEENGNQILYKGYHRGSHD